jgi:hypothetical protein
MRRPLMHSTDPLFAWVHAAELAALVREASRWDWGPVQRRLVRAVAELTERVYAGDDPEVLAPLFDEVAQTLLAQKYWAATHREDHLRAVIKDAREAFFLLRYRLFEDGPPLAA